MFVSKKTLADLNEEISQLKQVIDEMGETHQQELERLKSKAAAAVQDAENNTAQAQRMATEAYNGLVDASNAEIDSLRKALDEAQAEVKRLRAENTDASRYKEAIKRLVEPVEMSAIRNVYGGEYTITESAGYYRLSNPKRMPFELLLPKSGLRLCRNNGHLENLTKPIQSIVLPTDRAIHESLPPGMRSPFYCLYVISRSGQQFVLATPQTATNIIVMCLAEKTPTFSNWLEAYDTRVLSIKDSMEGKNLAEVYFVLAFPGDDPDLRFDPEVDDGFLVEDIDAAIQERERKLREACHQEYVHQHFATT